MTSQTASRVRGDERSPVEVLRSRFEREGFTFTPNPTADQLPDFLGSYVPDALARKPGHNVVIQVRPRPGTAADRPLQEIRRLFDGRANWHLHVVVLGENTQRSRVIAAPPPAAIRTGFGEVRRMLADGYTRPAFVSAWSLLEATLRTRDLDTAAHPLPAGTLVQALAMNGLIDPEGEQTLRALVDLPDRIVHGDLSAQPEAAQVEQVVAAAEKVLGSRAR